MDVIEGFATFKNKNTILVNNESYEAKNFIIATGSRPNIPNIEGIKTIKYLSNENIFDLKKIPDSLIIVGTGVIAIEMATAFNRLGSTVTIVSRNEGILKGNDVLLNPTLERREPIVEITEKQIGIGIAKGVSGFIKGRKAKAEEKRLKEQMADRMKAMEGLDTSNPYADVKNQYKDMENTMEDLEVNTQQAEFERDAASQAKDTALPPQRLTDQKALGFGMKQARRVKLKELHVRELRTGTVRHRDPVARRHVRVRRVEVHLAGAARRKNRRAREVGLDAPRRLVEDVCAHDLAGAAKLRRLHEVDGHVVFHDLDARRCGRSLEEHTLDFFAGDVSRMNDTPGAVTALSREIEREVLLASSELSPEVHQVLDSPGAVTDDHLDDLAVRKPPAGADCVVDVGLE